MSTVNHCASSVQNAWGVVFRFLMERIPARHLWAGSAVGTSQVPCPPPLTRSGSVLSQTLLWLEPASGWSIPPMVRVTCVLFRSLLFENMVSSLLFWGQKDRHRQTETERDRARSSKRERRRETSFRLKCVAYDEVHLCSVPATTVRIAVVFLSKDHQKETTRLVFFLCR